MIANQSADNGTLRGSAASDARHCGGAPVHTRQATACRNPTEARLTDPEFRPFYRQEESFLEEWLIAKCGVATITRASSRIEIPTTFGKSNDGRFGRVPKEDRGSVQSIQTQIFDCTFVEVLYTKIRGHNRRVETCHQNAVAMYQREWATSFLKLILIERHCLHF